MKMTYGRCFVCLSVGAGLLLGLGLLIRLNGRNQSIQTSAEAALVGQASEATTVAGDPKLTVAGVPLPERTISVTTPGTPNDRSGSTEAGTAESDIELPSPFERGHVNALLARMERERVYRAQDAAMAAWPKYADVRERLYQELASEWDLERLPQDQLVARALQLRDEFWSNGGNSSPEAYTQAYKARILLELAHRKEPEDMHITDELVETIQAAWVWWKFKGDTKIRTADNVKDLLDLRLAQCQRIGKEVENGRAPTWDDFVRANDLAWLLHRARKHQAAEKIVDWLIREADKGGWSVYRPPLESWKGLLQVGKQTYVYHLYTPMNSQGIEEVPYGRRLPSFQGPAPEKRGLVPRHLGSEPLDW